jgi:hypothetical protein
LPVISINMKIRILTIVLLRIKLNVAFKITFDQNLLIIYPKKLVHSPAISVVSIHMDFSV